MFIDIYKAILQNVATSETEIEHHLLSIILNACHTDPRFIFF